MGSDNSKKEFISPEYPQRTNSYSDEWAREIKNKLIASCSAVPSPSSENGDEGSPSFSPERLETLIERVQDLYETTNKENYSAKLTALFACLGQVWAGVQLIRAFIALNEREKSEFDALSKRIDAKFTELRARDSVIRIRTIIWEIERLLNLPSLNSSMDLDKNVNLLMHELMEEGPTSALEEIYASLGGGHRAQMERYILHVLHFLFNGMSKNNELLHVDHGPGGSAEYIGRQYSAEKQKKVVNNVCEILRRFDEDLKQNLEKDFDEYLDNFDFLVSKYDWLHLHRTKMWQILSGDYPSYYCSSDFVPRVCQRRGEFSYWLHYIPKDIWIDPTDEEIASAREVLIAADKDFTPGANRFVLMAKRMNQRQLAWWGLFYGDRNAEFTFSTGYPTRCSVAEWLDPHEWRVLLCGKK